MRPGGTVEGSVVVVVQDPPALCIYVLLEIIKIVIVLIGGLLNDLDSYKLHYPDEVSPYVFKEWPGTLKRPLEMMFRNSMEDISVADVVPALKKPEGEYTQLQANIYDKHSLWISIKR